MHENILHDIEKMRPYLTIPSNDLEKYEKLTLRRVEFSKKLVKLTYKLLLLHRGILELYLSALIQKRTTMAVHLQKLIYNVLIQYRDNMKPSCIKQLIKVCDEEEAALHKHHKELLFLLTKVTEDMDVYCVEIYKKIKRIIKEIEGCRTGVLDVLREKNAEFFKFTQAVRELDNDNDVFVRQELGAVKERVKNRIFEEMKPAEKEITELDKYVSRLQNECREMEKTLFYHEKAVDLEQKERDEEIKLLEEELRIQRNKHKKLEEKRLTESKTFRSEIKELKALMSDLEFAAENYS